MNTGTRIAISLVAVITLVGCAQNPPQNYGQSGRRIDPSHDAPGEIGLSQLKSADLVTATDRMARDIASRTDLVDPANPPVVVLGSIENHTTQPERNLQVFLARLRAQLNSSLQGQGIEFVANRDRVERARELEYGGKDPSKAASGYMSKAQYTLTCEIRDLPSGPTNYFLLDYQLIRFSDGSIVWENYYEVKFQ